MFFKQPCPDHSCNQQRCSSIASDPPGQIFPLLPDIITHSELPLHWCVNNPIQPFVNCTFTNSRGSHRHTLGHRWNYGCDSWCCLWKATCTWHGQSVQEGSKWKAPNIKMVYCSTLLHPRNREQTCFCCGNIFNFNFALSIREQNLMRINQPKRGLMDKP